MQTAMAMDYQMVGKSPTALTQPMVATEMQILTAMA
jgi:hypothetical protein